MHLLELVLWRPLFHEESVFPLNRLEAPVHIHLGNSRDGSFAILNSEHRSINHDVFFSCGQKNMGELKKFVRDEKVNVINQNNLVVRL